MVIDYAPLTAPLEEFRQAQPDVDLAYGVIAEGRLVHAAQPDRVFRIASMTKSFVAAAALLLRDRGTLGFDEPVERMLPSAGRLRLPDGRPARLTMRQLLSMQAGLPTDDPWADRLEATSPEDFDRLLGSGIRFIAEPGTRFKYANLGYAIAGRVLEEASRRSLPELIAAEILDPLGLHSTGFSADNVRRRRADAGLPAPEFATGRRRRPDDTLEDLKPTGPGAFSAIGGLYSSVEDLSVWVSGLMAAGHGAGVIAVPDSVEPRPGDAGSASRPPAELPNMPESEDGLPGPTGTQAPAHPLSRAQRQELQAAHRLIEVRNRFDIAAGTAVAQVHAYGFGLRSAEDSRSGTAVWHSGGYPGFGSSMRWHTGAGLGVIALAGLSRAPMEALLERGFADALSRAENRPRVPEREISAAREWRPAAAQHAQLWPELPELPQVMEALIADFDDARADALFSANMDADVPRGERHDLLARSRTVVGAPGPVEDVRYLSPARVSWRVQGEHGWRRAMASLNPLGQVQSLTVESYPAPHPAVDRAFARMTEALAGFDFLWPREVEFAGADLVSLVKAARVARTLGEPELGRYIATGESWGTAEVRFGTSIWHLTLELTAPRDYAGAKACTLVNISL